MFPTLCPLQNRLHHPTRPAHGSYSYRAAEQDPAPIWRASYSMPPGGDPPLRITLRWCMSNFFHLSITQNSNARGGIRTHGLLRERILSPSVLAGLTYPRSKRSNNYYQLHVISPTLDNGFGRRRDIVTFFSIKS